MRIFTDFFFNKKNFLVFFFFPFLKSSLCFQPAPQCNYHPDLTNNLDLVRGFQSKLYMTTTEQAGARSSASLWSQEKPWALKWEQDVQLKEGFLQKAVCKLELYGSGSFIENSCCCTHRLVTDVQVRDTKIWWNWGTTSIFLVASKALRGDLMDVEKEKIQCNI